MQSGDTTDRRSLIPGADILGARVGGWLVCGPLLGEFEVGSKQHQSWRRRQEDVCFPTSGLPTALWGGSHLSFKVH